MSKPLLTGEYDEGEGTLRVYGWILCPNCGKVEPTAVCSGERHTGGPGKTLVFKLAATEEP